MSQYHGAVRDTRRPLRSLLWTTVRTLVLVAPLLGAGPRSKEPAYEVETVRGTQREVQAVDKQPARVEQGVEIIHGAQPGSRRADFKTRGYTLPPGERALIRRSVSHILRVYSTELGVRVPSDFAVDLRIFGNAAGYRRELGSDRPIAGFYRHATREAVVSAEGGPLQTRQTSLHESSHAVLMRGLPLAPAWLNEGLAEYFERIEDREGFAAIPPHPERSRWLRGAVAARRTLPLAQLLELDGQRWAAQADDPLYLAYTQAWSLVTFLMDEPESRAELRAVIADLRRQPQDSRAAFERHHPGGVAALEREWLRWLATAPRGHRY
jgi:hypothetical protein